MSETDRLALVSDLQHNPQLSAEAIAFLRVAIRDNHLEPTTRNNMANALTGAATHDPGLADVFRGMVEDPSQDYLWREYAIQHMATATEWTADKGVIVKALWRQVETGEKSIPGTALLHLHYLDQRKIAPLENTFQQRLGAIIANEKADPLTRSTCVGIAGQRHCGELAPQIRELAQSAPAALRRVSIATLGLIGNAADLEQIRAYTKDADHSIANVARSAERRLLAANTKTGRAANVPVSPARPPLSNSASKSP